MNKKNNKLQGGTMWDIKIMSHTLDILITSVNGTLIHEPILALKNFYMTMLAEGKTDFEVYNTTMVGDKEHRAINEDNEFLKIFVALTKAFLPFAHDYNFQQVLELYSKENILDTGAMVLGAMLGYICLAVGKINTSFENVTGFLNPMKMSIFNQKGGCTGVEEVGGLLILVVVMLAVIAGIALAVTLMIAVISAFVVCFIAVMIVVLVIVVGTIYLFHDSIIWAITYIGNILMAFLTLLPVYLIIIRGGDNQDSLNKALEFYKAVPLNKPYDNMNNMTNQYPRSMDSFDKITNLGTTGVGTLGKISTTETGALSKGMQGTSSVANTATLGIGAVGTEGAFSGTSQETEEGEDDEGEDEEEDDNDDDEDDKDVTTRSLDGGFNTKTKSLCDIINVAKLLDPSLAQPQDLFNAISKINPGYFQGTGYPFGVMLVLLGVILFNNKKYNELATKGTVNALLPKDAHAMIMNFVGAPEGVIKQAAENLGSPNGESINSIAKPQTTDQQADKISSYLINKTPEYRTNFMGLIPGFYKICYPSATKEQIEDMQDNINKNCANRLQNNELIKMAGVAGGGKKRRYVIAKPK